jgi:FkbM family methyltransferase
MGVGWQLRERGSYDPHEMLAVRRLCASLRRLRGDLVAVDVGANIGAHSLVLANEVGPTGKVFAFEAQRIVFYMLAGNLALNSIENVYAFHNAVSDQSGSIEIPQFDYSRPFSVGSVEFGDKQTEDIGQERLSLPEKRDFVETIRLDEKLASHVDFLKIDVEGMELKVLDGARGIIENSRPVMLVEFLKSDRLALIKWLTSAGYRMFTGIGDNFFCVHGTDKFGVGGLPEVRL